MKRTKEEQSFIVEYIALCEKHGLFFVDDGLCAPIDLYERDENGELTDCYGVTLRERFE